MIQRYALPLALAAGLAVSAAPAVAEVRYDFTADSSFDFNGETFSGSFSVIVPDFITVSTSIPVEELLSCTVVASSGDAASCRNQDFLFNVSPDWSTVSFGVSTSSNPGTGIYYYFDLAAFSTVGTHETQIFGADQHGMLTVSMVPEPATWATLAGGLLALGLAVRQRAR